MATLNQNPLHICPITHEPFKRPWILIEDGFTYEKNAIEDWLAANPRISPFLGKLNSATLMPNCSVAKNVSTDPISGKPFRTAYYCIEDCHTYELDSIVDLFNKSVMDRLMQKKYSAPLFKTPASEILMNTITLVPNKVLSQDDIPNNQNPLRHNRSLASFINEVPPASSLQPIFDTTIRELINTHCSPPPEKGRDEYYKERQVLSEAIRNRRQELNLSTEANPPRFTPINEWLELSDLDLSDMKLNNIFHKYQRVINANFANTQFTNCSFAQLVDCNLENSVFQSTSFLGSSFSIFRSNVKNASFTTDISLEKGTQRVVIENGVEFIKELKNRGAVNADTIKFIN